MDLQELRVKIDEIDRELIKLFEKRMDVAADIAAWKRENRIPVLDSARERDKLNEVGAASREDLSTYTQMLYSMMFELSRSYQEELSRQKTDLHVEVENAIETTPRLFPTNAMIACQGTEGAYSQLACSRLFKSPMIMYFKSFESVFAAIESGFCQYGILPIENSSAGSVKQVYDLMLRHNFRIVRSCRLKVDHSLLAAPGVKKEDIKEIFSHQQALQARQLAQQPLVVAGRLPDELAALDHQVLDVRLQLQPAQPELVARLQQAVRRLDQARRRVAAQRHARVHVRHRRHNLVEEPTLVLVLQQQVREARQIALRVPEALDRQHVVADPVQVHPDQAVAVHEDAVVVLHRAVADGEQRGQRVLLVRRRRVRQVPRGDEAPRKSISHG